MCLAGAHNGAAGLFNLAGMGAGVRLTLITTAVRCPFIQNRDTESPMVSNSYGAPVLQFGTPQVQIELTASPKNGGGSIDLLVDGKLLSSQVVSCASTQLRFAKVCQTGPDFHLQATDGLCAGFAAHTTACRCGRPSGVGSCLESTDYLGVRNSS
eukprot:SAG31_NODE_12568_length_932_cov_0.972389_1_plen_155_part_00